MSQNYNCRQKKEQYWFVDKKHQNKSFRTFNYALDEGKIKQKRKIATSSTKYEVIRYKQHQNLNTPREVMGKIHILRDGTWSLIINKG